jgi:hypothetical protein
MMGSCEAPRVADHAKPLGKVDPKKGPILRLHQVLVKVVELLQKLVDNLRGLLVLPGNVQL